MRLPRPLRTSSFRFTLLYAGVFLVSTLFVLGIVAVAATSFLARQIDATVANELAEVQADAADTGPQGLRDVVQSLATRSPGIFYLLQDANRRVLAGNMEAIRPAPGLRSLTRLHALQARHSTGGIRGRGILLPDGAYLFVGLSDFELNEMRAMIVRAFLWGLGAIILLAVAGGTVMSLAVLRRIETISATSREIMRGDLSRRIPLHGTDDEFDHLATSLNAMFDRIQSLMSGLQQVSNDIAHDLRTPLTRLRQRLELARQRETTTEGLQAAVDDSIVQSEAILETFAALLRIAQIEAGTRRAGFAMVDVSAILSGLADDYQVVAEERGKVLHPSVTPGLHVWGDRQLLTLLYVNLIENAFAHSAGADVHIQAGRDADNVHTVIADSGRGIPDALHDDVLRRFFRLETSRTTPGNGLGLSLVKAIATLHDAELVLSDNRPGLRAAVTFRGPAAAVARGEG